MIMQQRGRRERVKSRVVVVRAEVTFFLKGIFIEVFVERGGRAVEVGAGLVAVEAGVAVAEENGGLEHLASSLKAHFNILSKIYEGKVPESVSEDPFDGFADLGHLLIEGSLVARKVGA